MNKQIAPKWAMWISMVILVAFNIALAIGGILDINSNYSMEPLRAIGSFCGIIAIIYLLGFIPVKSIYQNLKVDQ